MSSLIKQPRPSKELTKNILKNRSCTDCARLTNLGNNWCELYEFKPEVGVCSQWKMGVYSRIGKQIDHNVKVKDKRRKKKAEKKFETV